ncbi:MAG: aminodeoxychorismate synthase component I [Myxococcota bacterium]
MQGPRHDGRIRPAAAPRARACRVRRLPAPLALSELACAWADRGPLVLLDSADPDGGRARWSVLGAEPFAVFTAGPDGCTLDGEAVAGSALEALDAVLARYALPAEAGATLPFRGGALGYLAYELLHELEEVPAAAADDLPVPRAQLLLCDAALVHDHDRDETWLVANGFGEEAAEAAARADARLAQWAARVAGTAVGPAPAPRVPDPQRLDEAALVARGVVPRLDAVAYRAVVARARAHIRAGDLFEVCTTNRFQTGFTGDTAALYRALRRVNPAPFAAWLKLPGVEVLSASPERFLRRDARGSVETAPIKGTRPRAADPAADRALRDALAASEKDRAENVMIVDLARNDLGRVCGLGSVSVPSLCAVHSYAFVHQLVSTVRGRLRPGTSTGALLRAAFPGGSMTGAPKVEAMRRIAALEPVARGVFSGAIGYVDFEGALDLSIVIRTFVKVGDALTFHVGGAVVWDSDPASEHQEILDKAAGLVAALDLVCEHEPPGRRANVTETARAQAPGRRANVTETARAQAGRRSLRVGRSGPGGGRARRVPREHRPPAGGRTSRRPRERRPPGRRANVTEGDDRSGSDVRGLAGAEHAPCG